jgi:hypothetical protein
VARERQSECFRVRTRELEHAGFTSLVEAHSGHRGIGGERRRELARTLALYTKIDDHAGGGECRAG